MGVLDDIKAKAAATQQDPKATGEKLNPNPNNPPGNSVNVNNNNTRVDDNRAIVGKDGKGNDIVVQPGSDHKSDFKQDDKSTITTDTVSGVQRDSAILDKRLNAGEFLYSSPNSDGFSIMLSDGEARAKEGLLKLNKKQHEEVQALLKTGRPDIAQNLILLDPDAAAAIAREHMARHRKPDAVKGPVNSHGTQQEAQGAQNTNFRELKPTGEITYPHQASVEASSQNVRNQAVIEEEVHHADDSNLNPENGQHAGRPFQE